MIYELLFTLLIIMIIFRIYQQVDFLILLNFFKGFLSLLSVKH